MKLETIRYKSYYSCYYHCSSQFQTWNIFYSQYSIKFWIVNLGDDPASAQTLLELMWEYSVQMSAQQLTSPFEYVARCRHWKQFQLDRQQAIQSQPSSSNAQPEAHLPVLASVSPQQQCMPASEPVVTLSNSEQRDWSNTGRNFSPLPMAPPPVTQSRAHGILSAPTSQESELTHTTRQFITESAQNPQPPAPSVAQQLERSEANSYRSSIEQNEEISSDCVCRVCYDKPFNVVLVPCGHLAVCSSCAERCKDCPICRRSIRGTVRI